MTNRTLVYMIFRTDCISLRTVNRSRKSPHHFYILRSRLEKLEHASQIIVQDIHSFAVLRWDHTSKTLKIEFTWLSSDGCSVSGYKETVVLPYDKMAAFLSKSTLENKPAVWKTLSIDNSNKRPQLIFKSRKNLHDAIADHTIRHKLAKSLRDEFHWPQAERIEFYDDFLPYSFVFREIRNNKPAMSGGFILHQQDDIQKAYYSVHT